MEINNIGNNNNIIKQKNNFPKEKINIPQNSPDTVKLPNNPSFYAAYNNISFKGKVIDNSNFRNDLKNRAENFSSNIQIKNSTVNGDFYKTNHSEYIILPENNKLYKLRYTKDTARIKEQVLASQLYQSVGVRTPEYIPFEKEGKTGYLVEIIEEKLTPAEENSQALYDSFIADVWLGNRNGMSRNNTVIDKDGKPVKMSVSGSLNYRATGKPKEKNLYYNVDEIYTMRDPKFNQESAEALRNMSDDSFYQAIENFNSKYSYDTIKEITGEYKAEGSWELYNILNNRAHNINHYIKEFKNNRILEKRGFLNGKDFNGEELSSIDKEYILKITDEEWEILKQRNLLQPSSDIKDFSYIDLSRLAKMTEEEHKNALKRGLYIPRPGEGKSYFSDKYFIGGYDIYCFSKLTDEQWDIVEKRKLLDIKDKHYVATSTIGDFVTNNLLNISNLDWIDVEYSRILDSYCDEKTFGQFMDLLHDDKIKDLKPSFTDRLSTMIYHLDRDKIWNDNYDAKVLLSLAVLDNDKWQRIDEFTNNFNKLQVKGGSLLYIAELDEESFQTVKRRGLLENIKGAYGLNELAMLSDEEWDNVQKRNLMEKYPNDFMGWAYLGELTDEEYQKAIDKHLFEARCDERFVDSVRFFSPRDINSLIKDLSDEDWDNIEKRDLIKGYRYTSESGYLTIPLAGTIEELAKLNDTEFKKFNELNNYAGRYRLYPSTQIELTKLDDIQYKRIFDRNLFNYTNRYEGYDDYTMDAPIIKMLAELDDKDYQSFLNQNNNCKTLAAKVLIVKADKLGLDKKQALSELSFKEKKAYLQLLLKDSGIFLSSDFIDNYAQSAIIPQNIDEYVNVINKLVKSSGINTKPLSDNNKTQFYNAIDKLSAPNSEFSKLDMKDTQFKINLKYPLSQFISDVSALTQYLDTAEKMKIWDYFGFELSQHKDEYYMSGYPVLINNGEKLKEIENPHTRQMIELIKPYVENFTENNGIIADNKFISESMADTLNSVCKAMPELYSIIGKQQHKTHDYTLDIHTLSVLQECVKSPEFQNLSNENKHTLIFSTLLHDIEKQIGERNHAQSSAYSAYYILEKFELNEPEKLNIYQLIKNHELLKDCNLASNEDQYNRLIQGFAYELRSDNLTQLAKILSKADLLSVKRDGSFYYKHQNAFEKTFNKLETKVQGIANSAIPLPQTKIPKADKIKVDNINSFEMITEDENGCEIRNKVLYLSPGLDLTQYGFDENTNTDNLNFLVHSFDNEAQQAILGALGLVDQNALLSTSYIIYNKGNYHTFRPQGFIMDVPADNIGVAYYRDFGSGYQKTIDSLVNNYLYGTNYNYREYFSNLLKNELNLDNKQYTELYKQIKDKPLSVLEKENPTTAEALKNIFKNMEIHKRKYGRDYNEILVTKGKPAGIFFEGKNKDDNPYKFEDLPIFLRKYAQDNNLPIIYMGK